MKFLITLSLSLVSALSFANVDGYLSTKIIDLEKKILEEKDISISCSEWVEKTNCLSYLERFEKEFTFNANKYGLKKIIIDELEDSTIQMNKVVRVSVFKDFNKQLYKIVPTIYKIDELNTLSRSYSKDYSFRIFCGASLTARQCELGLFNFLKSKPKNISKGKVKKVIITKADKDLSEKGSLFISHENKNPKNYIQSQTEERTPANSEEI